MLFEMFNAYLTYSMYFISCVLTVRRVQLMLQPTHPPCSVTTVGGAGTAAGGWCSASGGSGHEDGYLGVGEQLSEVLGCQEQLSWRGNG